MAKKVIKAAKAKEKVEALSKDKEKKKVRSAKEVRTKLYGSDE